MKNYFIFILKGFLIGIGKIIPGVSGAIIAVSLNVYDICLKALSSFFSDFKNNIYILSSLSIGILIAIVFFSNIIEFLLYKYYFFTMIFFIGIFFASIFSIKNKIINKNYLVILLSFLIVLSLCLPFYNNIYSIRKDNLDIFIFFIGGILEAMGTVIPGLSATGLLLLLGIYDKVINLFSNFYNFFYLWANIRIIISFTLGMFFGIILFVKLIVYLFNRYENILFNVILGICISQILLLLITTFNRCSFNIFGIFVFFVGFLIGILFDK